jgi:hypothetical protein
LHPGQTDHRGKALPQIMNFKVIEAYEKALEHPEDKTYQKLTGMD